MNQSIEVGTADLTKNNATNLIVQASTIFGIALVITLLRCYVRIFILKSFGKDDWTIVVSMGLATVGFGCYLAQVSLGFGKHLSVIQLDQGKYRQLLKIRLIHEVCVNAGVAVVKISVTYMLLRLATKRRETWFLYSLIIVLAVLGIAYTSTLGGSFLFVPFILANSASSMFLLIFDVLSCLPVAAIWDYRLRPSPMGTGDARCLSVKTFSNIALFNSIVNIATDFLLAFLPIPVVWNLQFNRRTKVLLAFVLSLGTFASVAGIMKAHVSSAILNDPEHFVHDTYSMWNYIELDVGIIAACLPATKPIFNRSLQAARSVCNSHTTKTIRFSIRAPSSVGYTKQNEDFGSVLELGQCHGGSSTATVSSKLPEDREARPWSIRRGHSCDKATRTSQYDGSDHKSILVTSDIRID